MMPVSGCAEVEPDREAQALRIFDAHVYGNGFIVCAEDILTGLVERQERYMSMR